MARRVRDPRLETRTARLRLPVAHRPVFVPIARGLALGYRRTRTSGTWTVRATDGRGGKGPESKIGVADDFEAADGKAILDYWQAQDLARTFARDERHDGKPSVTVDEALTDYENDLRVRGRDLGNVGRVRAKLPEALLRKSVVSLTARELRSWRNGLAQLGTTATANRTAKAFRAALGLAAAGDDRIVNHAAWKNGLSAIPGAEQSRNVILSDTEVLAIIDAAYADSEALGLLVEVAAVTGARYSQIARLEVADLQDDRPDPRLMMPVSRKGRQPRPLTARFPVPILTALAVQLRRAAADRRLSDPLLLKIGGDRWRRSNQQRCFRRIVRTAGLDPREVTIYALRHSNIVRQLLAGVPVRVVAVNHDTSVVMIERNYSSLIGDHADALVRRVLLDRSQPSDQVVVPLMPRRSARR